MKTSDNAVQPSPPVVWSTGFPKAAGWYWIEGAGGSERIVAHVGRSDVLRHDCRFAGPIPMPLSGTTDFPKIPGWYWCLVPNHGWIIEPLDDFDCKEPLRLDFCTHVAGPIPEPVEPEGSQP